MGKRYKKYLTVLAVLGTLLTAGLAIALSLKLRSSTPVTSDLASENIQVKAVKEEKVDIPSPDGKYTLSVKNAKEVNGIRLQTFSISSEEDKTPIKIYEKESNAQNLVIVPDNTFSPDNKYIFLKSGDSGQTQYIILRTDGKEIKKESQSVEIEIMFSEKYSDFVITDVTGWGGYSLIVVNTNTKEGKTGPSWWFDLSNFSFIKLSSRFN